MSDATDTEQRLSDCAREIRALGVSRLSLFGSILRGEAQVDSDVDLLVQFRPGTKTYAHFSALSDLLEGRLGRRVGSRPRPSRPSWAHTSWRKRAMSFEPRDYLRHILVETEYLMAPGAGLSYEAFAGLRRQVTDILAA